MTTRFPTVLGLILLCLGADPARAQQRARTTDGKEVILRKDGTWVYADEAAKGSKDLAKKTESAVPQFTKAKDAVEQYRGKRGTFALWLVPGVWNQSTNSNESVEVQFRHKDGGEAIAMVIAERLS